MGGQTFFNNALHYHIQRKQIKNGRPKHSWPCYPQFFCPTRRHTDINRMTHYIYGVVKRNTNNCPHSSIVALKIGFLHAVANIPTFIWSLPAQQLERQLLHLVMVSINDAIQCVHGHVYRMLKKSLSLSHIFVLTQALTCLKITALFYLYTWNWQ